MAAFRVGPGKVQDETGTSCARKKENAQKKKKNNNGGISQGHRSWLAGAPMAIFKTI